VKTRITPVAIGASLLVILCLSVAFASEAQRVAGTGEPRIYTAAQAARGKDLYLENCGSCHAPDLTGSPMAPPLGRQIFAGGRRSFRQLFDFVQLFMPVFSPNGLSRQQNSDILAFILQTAGYPAGATELPVSSEAQDAITLSASLNDRSK